MKKTLLMLLVICVLLLVGCATEFDNSLLLANDHKIEKLLPMLEMTNSSNETSITSPSREITTNSYLYTIWQRELENNICDSYGTPMGRIEMTIANVSIKTSNSFLPITLSSVGGSLLLGGYFAFSYDYRLGLVAAGALSSIAAVMVPMKATVDLDIEVRIYANNKTQVWKKQYLRTNTTKVKFLSKGSDVAFLNSENGNSKTNLILQTFKAIIEDFKVDVEKDYDDIILRLKENNSN